MRIGCVSVFIDQDEIIPHLEPGRLPSTVDPDAVEHADKGKKLPPRQVRISAWKLAKLDSNEAVKAAAKARASSSVLRPIGSRHHPYDAEELSSSNVSGRSSPMSTNQGFQSRYSRGGTSKKSSYPPSRASREDSEMYANSFSNISSPQVSNIAPSPLQQQDHFNPVYQSSADQSPSSTRQSRQGNELAVRENIAQAPPTRRNPDNAESSRTSVFWDPEAGRFVSSTSRGTLPSSQAPPAQELLYTGQSIFFGGPLVNDQPSRGTRTSNPMTAALERGTTSSNYYQQGRSQRGGQLPVFVPSDSNQKQNHSSSSSSRLH